MELDARWDDEQTGYAPKCERCGTADAVGEFKDLDGNRSGPLCPPCITLHVGGKPPHPTAAVRRWLDAMDPAERIRAADRLAMALRGELAGIRADAAREMHRQLGSWHRVAAAVGMTRGRAANLAAGRRQTGRRSA